MKIKNISVKPICIGDASLLPGDTAEVGDTFADAVGFYISMGLMQGRAGARFRSSGRG